ncbi:MAG TPA: hypothetical protein PLL38_02110, partial [Anaerolineales bacterium]|nr:hypothetical protein [Anaerolineales bacterium]
VFNRVFARKPGALAPAGHKSVKDVLLCQQCGQVGKLSKGKDNLKCSHCQKQVLIDENGIAIFE